MLTCLCLAIFVPLASASRPHLHTLLLRGVAGSTADRPDWRIATDSKQSEDIQKNHASLVESAARNDHRDAVPVVPATVPSTSSELPGVHDAQVKETDNSALKAQGLSTQSQTAGLADVPLPADNKVSTVKEPMENGKDPTQGDVTKEDLAESSAQAADTHANPMQGAPSESLQVAYPGKPEHLAPTGSDSFSHFFSCKSCKALIDYQGWLQNIQRNANGFEHVLLITLLVVWAICLIWLLTTTAQHFFVPPLIYWSQLLRLRPEVAGATLLAMGNGAPDVFAATAAANKEQIPLALSELIGSNVFVLCMTGGSVVLASKMIWPSADAIHFHSDRFLESILGYCMVMVILALVLHDGVVSTVEAFALPCGYILFVVMLVVRGQGDSEEVGELLHGSQVATDNEQLPSSVCGELSGNEGLPTQQSNQAIMPTTKKQVELPVCHPLAGMQLPKGSDVYSTICFLLAWPTFIARWVTIPSSDGHWDRTRRVLCTLSPTGLFLFLILTGCAFQEVHKLAITWALVLVPAMLGAMIYVSSDDGPQLPRFYPLVTLTAKVSSVIWLYVIATELTAVVESLGRAFYIPPITLGFTSIAWGNACGDLLSCLVMVQRNQSRAAFAAVLAGPIFNNLIGLGVVLVIAAHARGGEIILWESAWPAAVKVPMLAGLASILCAICTMLCMIHFDKKKSTHKWAYAMFASYSIFFGAVVAREFIVE